MLQAAGKKESGGSLNSDDMNALLNAGSLPSISSQVAALNGADDCFGGLLNVQQQLDASSAACGSSTTGSSSGWFRGRSRTSSDQARWMTGTETLVAQGFPVHCALHAELLAIKPPVTSFAVKLSGRSPRVVAEQSGNSMHIGCLLPQLMYDYRGVRLISDDPIIRSLNQHKRLRASQQHDVEEEQRCSRPRHALTSDCTT